MAAGVTAEFLRQNAPFAAAAFFVRSARAEDHRPQRPRRIRRPLVRPRIAADVRRLRQQLELRQAAAALPIRGAVAVAPRVAAADHDHVLAGRQNLILDRVSLIAGILLRQEFHREMDSLEVAAGDRQIAALRRPAGQQDRIELVAQLRRWGHSRRHSHCSGTRPLRLSICRIRRQTCDFSSLKSGMPYINSPPGRFGPLEDRHLMAGPIQLLGGGQSGRAGADHGHALAAARLAAARARANLRRSPDRQSPFDLLDRHRVFVDPQHASRFAWGRANAPREFGEIIRRLQPLQSLAPMIAIHQIVPVGDDVPQRAAGVAERHAAIHAPGALLLQLLGPEHLEKLVEVL